MKPEDVCTLLARVFAERGHKLYLVGGTVRDTLLGLPSHDVDLTTGAVPDEVKRLVALTNPSAVFSVGERFGTIGAIYGEDDPIEVEITTFRSEWYEPRSRKPKVEFGTKLEGDLARRDFTINAIAMDLITGEIIDPFEGLLDVRRKLIRAVGDPDQRFSEDPLRLLRAVRLHTQLDFAVEQKTRDAIARNASSIAQISRERILEEMNRILLCERPSRGLAMLSDLDLAVHIIPELVALRATSQGRRMKDVFAHTLAVVDRSPADLVVRWSAVLHDVGKPRTVISDGKQVHFPGHELVGEQMSREILSRLRMDTHTTERVSRLIGLHMRANQYDESWTDGAVRRLLRDADEDFDLLLALSTADVTSYRPAKIRAAVERVEKLRERGARLEAEESVRSIKSPLDGNDLMVLFGRGPGPWIRPMKDYLLDLVIEGKLAQDDRETAERLAEEKLAEIES